MYYTKIRKKYGTYENKRERKRGGRKTIVRLLFELYSIHSSIQWSICPSIPPSICPSIQPSIHSSIHSSISIHLSIHLSIHPSIYPFIYPFIHPSIHSLINPYNPDRREEIESQMKRNISTYSSHRQVNTNKMKFIRHGYLNKDWLLPIIQWTVYHH